jgi:hypothetical protein
MQVGYPRAPALVDDVELAVRERRRPRCFGSIRRNGVTQSAITPTHPDLSTAGRQNWSSPDDGWVLRFHNPE